MNRIYLLIACSAIIATINIHTMDRPTMDPDKRDPLFTLLDPVVGNSALGEPSNWDAIFSLLQKLSPDTKTIAFTVNEYLSQQGFTLLCHAIEDNNFLAVKTLLENFYANPNRKNALTGMTPLMFACKDGYAEIALLLLQHGADPLIQNNNGNDSFFFAETYVKYNKYDDTILRLLQSYKRK